MSPPWRAEIVRLHEFFEGWLGGALPDTGESFAAFEEVLADDFAIATPAGRLVSRAALVEGLRGGHGAHPELRIRIENAELRHSQGPIRVATYEEWQEEGGSETARLSTVVFRAREGTPNGLQWVHVHETWIRPPDQK